MSINAAAVACVNISERMKERQPTAPTSIYESEEGRERRELEKMQHNAHLFAFTDSGKELATSRGFPGGWSSCDDNWDGRSYFTDPTGAGLSVPGLTHAEDHRDGKKKLRQQFPVDPKAKSDAEAEGFPPGWYFRRHQYKTGGGQPHFITSPRGQQFTSFKKAIAAVESDPNSVKMRPKVPTSPNKRGSKRTAAEPAVHQLLSNKKSRVEATDEEIGHFEGSSYEQAAEQQAETYEIVGPEQHQAIVTLVDGIESIDHFSMYF